MPTVATANAVGDISNPGPNVVNYNFDADWNGQDGNVTTVGSGGPLSSSFYGTFDQGGNVYEWNEAVLGLPSFRGLRGGDWLNDSIFLAVWIRGIDVSPSGEFNSIGFRVATVPEPSTGLLGVFGMLGLMQRRRRSS